MLWSSAFDEFRARTCRSVPMTPSDRTTPIRVPRPPKILTPPSNTAATTSSSKPVALSDRLLDTLAV